MMLRSIRAILFAVSCNALAVPFSPSFAVTIPNINEFVVDHSGSDTNEYVEVFGGASSSNYSWFTIVEIEGDGANAGLVGDFVLPVGTTNSLGFWVSPFQTDVFGNGNVTLLMVLGWRGTVGDDIDVNNDGMIDTTFWSMIWDSVGVLDPFIPGFAYGQTNLTPNFDALSDFAPGGASRIPNGTDNNLVSEWRRNTLNYSLNAPADGEAFNTPGALNRWLPEPSSVVLAVLGALALPYRAIGRTSTWRSALICSPGSAKKARRSSTSNIDAPRVAPHSQH
jgi:hypothetical protein